MKILVTGSKGFVGKNLIENLINIRDGKTKKYPFLSNIVIYECDIDTSEEELESYCKNCDFVFHLAGINRPQKTEEFMEGNFGFTTILLDKLKKYNNKSSILMSSSIQAELENDYGKSKKAGEDYLLSYGKENNITTYIFRLPNVFGKWCRPNYNSAVATFCNNLACGLPITVNNPETELTLVYIDDVIDAFFKSINNEVQKYNNYCKVPIEHKAKLGYIVELIESFVNSRRNNICPHLINHSFEKKLYSTYLSYLPTTEFSYDLPSNIDNRGSFTEFLKTENQGQTSINISKPHIVKGNHWHNTKNEKFLVVSGKGVIRFRKVGDTKIIEYFVSSEKLEVVDIPVGYTHNIENLGDTDMVTIMWANECFDSENPDTFYLEV